MDLNRGHSYSHSYHQQTVNVSLNIQELVLVDVPVSDRQVLQQTVTTELTRLLQTEGMPGQWGKATQRSAQRPMVSADVTLDGSNQSPEQMAEQMGVAIACAIYQGLDRGLGQ